MRIHAQAFLMPHGAVLEKEVEKFNPGYVSSILLAREFAVIGLSVYLLIF